MGDHPLVQLTLSRMREFYREPEAIFWVFGFPIVLAFALGIAFRSRGPGELNVAVLRGPADTMLAATLDGSPALKAVVLDSAEGRQRLRTGRIALLVVPGGGGPPPRHRHHPPRPGTRRAPPDVARGPQPAAARADPAAVRRGGVADPSS